MPKYNYECSNCGEITIDKSMSEPSPTNCPYCNTPDLQRIYTPVTSIWNCSGNFGKSDKVNGTHKNHS